MSKFVVTVIGILAAALVAPVMAQTKVAIGTARDPNLGAQIVIASKQGYFKEEGLDADVKYFPSGGDLMSAFVGGSIDYGTGGSTPVMTVLARPYPLRIIAQVSDISGAQELIVKKDVNSLDQLKGKKIGLLPGTASEALVRAIFTTYHFDPSSVQIVNMGPTEMISTFVRGDVAAVSLWEPHSTKARELGDGKTLVSGTTSFIGGKTTANRIHGDHAVLFASESTVKAQPAVTKGVIAALEKANEYMKSHRSEAIAILAKEYSLKPADMSAVLDKNRYTLEINDQLVSDMDKLAAFLYSIKRISNPLHTRDAIDTAALASVRKALVQLK
jgi:ABC-type nitrate/sulfonate/bicarbonate transport system substrate-binding protein